MMRVAALTLGFVVAVLSLPGSGRAAEEKLTPSWFKVEKSARLVRLNIVAGWNANNGALNFNGYFSGDMTVVVPVAWAVEIAFKNNDAMLPHSLLVTKPFTKDDVPDKAGVAQVAIPRAYTNNPEEGIPSPKTDTVRFATKEAGNFYLFCGAPGHGHGGMWVKLTVDANADAPYVLIDKSGDPGRP
jgi:sulfocyanin